MTMSCHERLQLSSGGLVGSSTVNAWAVFCVIRDLQFPERAGAGSSDRAVPSASLLIYRILQQAGKQGGQRESGLSQREHVGAVATSSLCREWCGWQGQGQGKGQE